MNDTLEKVITLKSDYTVVKNISVTREDCLRNITMSLEQLATASMDTEQKQFLKPKYQFSLRGNIKDRRDLRGGVIFETPSLCLYALSLMVSSSSRVSLSFL